MLTFECPFVRLLLIIGKKVLFTSTLLLPNLLIAPSKKNRFYNWILLFTKV